MVRFPDDPPTADACWLPSTMEDAHVNISIGAAIRELVNPMVDGQTLEEKHRLAAEVLIASFFIPLLAREDRIAAYLGRSRNRVRAIGRRLRAAKIWVGTKLAPDCYEMLMEEDPFGAMVNIVLLAGVGIAALYAERREDGELVFSGQRPSSQVSVEMEPCEKCGTTKRYTEGGACVECGRRYMRGYFNMKEKDDDLRSPALQANS